MPISARKNRYKVIEVKLEIEEDKFKTYFLKKYICLFYIFKQFFKKT